MTILQRLFSVCVLLTLAACGGGGGSSGTSSFSPGGSGGGNTAPPVPVPVVPSATDLVLVLSAGSVANNGSETVVATATAIDAGRSVVVGVPVTISVNSNAIATPKSKTTDAAGQLSATVGIGADRSNRTITVTATSGTIVKTAALTVQDTGGGGSGAPSDLLLTLGSATIASTGGQLVTATATALDAKRNVLPGVVVSISVDAGATAIPSGTATNASGVVTAQVGIGGNPALRTITVTANATGLPPRTASLQVITAATTATPVAADLSLALSAGSLINGGSSTVLATVTAVDNNRNALAGIPVAISVDNNAVATVSGRNTDASGLVNATIGIGADRSNRSITVTATSGTITKSVTFAVVGATLSASFSPKVDAGSLRNQIEYRLVDANGTAMAGQQISVTSPGLPSASSTTDVNGKFNYFFNAPTSATTLSIVATAAGDSRTQIVSVQAPGSSTPIAATPQSASLTPTPSVVSVNQIGSANNQVELRALFLGANNLPVPNVRVRFSVDPSNSSDGVATQIGGSVYAYSDASGVARGTFIPGQRSSPTNGVTVRACWGVNDFDINAVCPANQLVTNTLTIASEALSVNIRTNNLVKNGAAGLTYIKEFVVMVVDAAGQAKADVLITPSVDLTGYYKGVYDFNPAKGVWERFITLADTENFSWNPASSSWVRGETTIQPICPNEDVNRNGVREAGVYVASAVAPALVARQEDMNWNGDIDPRKSDVAIKMVGSSRTDASGLAVVQIEYGQNLASWVDFVITVTASGIAGTESRARYIGNLPISGAAISDEKLPPPFALSPYGRSSVCTDNN